MGPLYDEVAVDEIVEEASAEILDARIDVRELWGKLIAVESEQTIGGVALGEGVYKKQLNRMVVPFELTSGVFDFSKGDTVAVEKLEIGRWFRIGSLDLKSRPDVLLIEGFDYGFTARAVQEGISLRFLSNFSQQSLKRRQDAVGRILKNDAKIPNLFGVFEGKLSGPFENDHKVDVAALEGYRLNPAQRKAFERILRSARSGCSGAAGNRKDRFHRRLGPLCPHARVGEQHPRREPVP